jgi:hypothetical protein
MFHLNLQVMKKVIIFSWIFMGISLACVAQNKTNKKSNNVVYAEEPTYLLDRRLAAALTATTDNNGASGAGTGSSYGATYYRSMAYKQAAAIAKQKNTSTSYVNNKVD